MDDPRPNPEDSPVGDTSKDKEREARRFYNSVFREVPTWLKVVYRGPLVIIAVVFAILATLGLPLVAGFALALIVASISANDGSGGALYWLGLWMIGLAVVGGLGGALIAVVAVWGATFDAIKRTWGLLRGE